MVVAQDAQGAGAASVDTHKLKCCTPAAPVKAHLSQTHHKLNNQSHANNHLHPPVFRHLEPGYARLCYLGSAAEQGFAGQPNCV